MEYTGEEVQICQFQEKLTVEILGAHVQAASNKTTSPRQCHELRETEEKVMQNRQKYRRCSGCYEELVRTTVKVKHKSAVKGYQLTVSTAQTSLFCA
jgi:hypothetical protein